MESLTFIGRILAALEQDYFEGAMEEVLTEYPNYTRDEAVDFVQAIEQLAKED